MMDQPQSKPQRQRITANIDPEQQRKEEEKLKQLAELKRKAQEEKNNPPKPVVKEEGLPKIDPKRFREEQKEVLSKIRKPKVEEVSAFDDIHSGA